jgi:hypothetical protein
MPVTKEHAKQLSDSIYSKGILSRWQILLLAITLLIVGFLINFNLRDIIRGEISAGLATLKSCPITYQKMKISFLPPAVNLIKPIIHGRCFDRKASNLNLESGDLKVAAPSLYPPGLKFHLMLKDRRSLLNIYSSISFSQKWIKIQNSSLQAESLAFLAGSLPTLNGAVAIDALISINANVLSSAQVYLKSNDLHLLGQNMSGFDIPDMKIGNFSFKGTYDPTGTLVINDLIVGNPLSPIVAQITGEIDVNQKKPPLSRLNLDGEIKFSPQLLQSFSILNMFLGGKREKNGFYQLSVRGTLQNPSPSIL